MYTELRGRLCASFVKSQIVPIQLKFCIVTRVLYFDYVHSPLPTENLASKLSAP